MLRARPPDERRVLLAHEDSHLRHRHHLFTQLADLAATANPLLRRSARAVLDAVARRGTATASRGAARAPAASP